jgi:hypothetical protein
VSSDGKGRAEVWSAEASLNCEDEDVAADKEVDVDAGGGVPFAKSMDAVAIDNRERTKSNGYVVPARTCQKCKRQIWVADQV